MFTQLKFKSTEENWPQPEINEEILRPLGRKKKGVKLRDAEVQA